MIETSAPGKLFLLGEYAVLTGAPALVLALPARARVSVLADPGITMVTAEEERVAPADVPMLAAAEQLLIARGACEASERGTGFRLDTSDFFDRTGRKLGFGSSAALVTALVAALWPAGVTDPHRLVAVARDVHTAWQGGRGSGADIAAAVHGGIIRYAMADTGSSLTWPAGLHGLFIDTGTPASTGDLLARLAAWREAGNAAVHDRCMQTLADSAGAGAAAFAAGETAAFVAEVHNFGNHLAQLSSTSGLGFYTAAHEHLLALASDRQCAYKPSGAGGGDHGVAFATDPDALEALRRELTANGHSSFYATPETPGLIIDTRAGTHADQPA